jgi:hypothetical protein
MKRWINGGWERQVQVKRWNRTWSVPATVGVSISTSISTSLLCRNEGEKRAGSYLNRAKNGENSAIRDAHGLVIFMLPINGLGGVDKNIWG